MYNALVDVAFDYYQNKNVNLTVKDFEPAWEWFATHFEDNDLKYRAIEAGYDCFVVNKACFFHYGSVTSRHLNYNYKKNEKYYYDKHLFAEYLSLYAGENQAFRFKMRLLENFPLNLICNNHLFIQKVIRKIKRILKF